MDKDSRSYNLEYNKQFDLVKLTYPNGLYREWGYDIQGRLIQLRDVKGNITLYKYDKGGNLINLEEPDGNIHHFQYDSSGNLIDAKDKLRGVQFTYGPLGVLQQRVQNGLAISFQYDSELQLRSIINEGGEKYRFGLDGVGQVIKEIGFDGIERTYIRNGVGNVSKLLRPCERWTTFDYDGTGNIVKEEHYDGTTTAYRYNADGLLIEAINEEGLLQFKRDRIGRIIKEVQGEHSVERIYNENGDCIQIISSLGANIQQQFDDEGNLINLKADHNWEASWKHDQTGLEIYRQLSGGVTIRTERDRFGREIRKSVGAKNIEQTRMSYHWGIGDRLQGIENELTGKHTNFDYDTFDNLIGSAYEEPNKQTETIYRAPDAIGNLYETPNKKDRIYGKGGRLLEDLNYFYHYDCEGNLIFKEFKKSQGYSSLGKEAIEKKYGIKFKGSCTGWLYEWSAHGMLQKVVSPQQGKIKFGYDALGRRTYKEFKNKRTHWLWEGNVPLHEWHSTKEQPTIDIVTWVFEDGKFVPCARITETSKESIVTDYLGTPKQMFDQEGNKTWEVELDIYGRIRNFEGHSLKDCPFRYQGQYQDEETGLYYNRFRYYDPNIGNYISQDPIGIGGGLQFYSYVHDTNAWIDILGLNVSTGANRVHVTYQGIKNGKPYTGYASAPKELGLKPEEIVSRRYGGDFKDFGGKAPEVKYSGEGVKGKQTARGLEQRLYEADVKKFGKYDANSTKGVANKQNPVGPNNKNRQKYLDSADDYLSKKNAPVNGNKSTATNTDSGNKNKTNKSKGGNNH